MNADALTYAEHRPPPGRCCHWRYEDTWPKFDSVTRMVDGKPVRVPVLIETPYAPPGYPDETVLAVAEFFTPQTCPKCEGALTCPDCGREFVPA